MPTRTLVVSGPLDLAATLAPLRRGRGDPTLRIAADGVWRAARTPHGPASVHLALSGGVLTATAWGPGSDWALEHVPGLAGLHDDPGGLGSSHPLLERISRRHPGLRLTRTLDLVGALVPAILEQKVTGREAHLAYRRLAQVHGGPAPGPVRLLLPPDPAVLAHLPSYALHPLGVERRRAETLRRACRRAGRLAGLTELPPAEARRRLVALEGIGPWTAFEATAVVHGDPDAVSPGDYNLPHLVAWALAGEPRADDARMLELLEPFRGQRLRVVRLLERSGIRPPRRAPRRPLRDIRRI